MTVKKENCPKCNEYGQRLPSVASPFPKCTMCYDTGRVDVSEEEMPSDRREEKEFDGAYADDDMED